MDIPILNWGSFGILGRDARYPLATTPRATTMTVIRSKKLRNAAKGMPCTIGFTNICNHDPETTILAHIHDAQFGMGMKADDTSAIWSCSACHSALDLHTHGLDDATLFKTLLRALQRTIRQLVINQVILVKLDHPPKPKSIKRKPKAERQKIQSRGFGGYQDNTKYVD